MCLKIKIYENKRTISDLEPYVGYISECLYVVNKHAIPAWDMPYTHCMYLYIQWCLISPVIFIVDDKIIGSTVVPVNCKERDGCRCFSYIRRDSSNVRWTDCTSSWRNSSTINGTTCVTNSTSPYPASRVSFDLPNKYMYIFSSKETLLAG